MRPELSIGLGWGLLIGLVGGLAAGLAEAFRILQFAAGRSGAQEAAIYALIVDALAFGAILGLAGGLTAFLFRLLGVRLAPPTLAAAYVSVGAGLAFFFGRLVSMFPARGLGGAPTATGLDIAISLASGVAGGVILFPIVRPLAWRLLRSQRRVWAMVLSVGLLLAAVLPAQLFVELRGHLGLSRGAAARAVDLDVLSRDFAASLEGQLEDVLESPASQIGDRPNVLFITVDALRADHVGACGNEWVETPWIDLLAKYGSLSCNTYTQQPQTNPAVASIFTSTYPAVHGVRMHMVDRLPDSFDTLAESIAGQGYATGAILPWAALEPAFSGFHQGFQVYEAFVVNAPATLENPVTASIGALYRRVTDQVAVGGAIEAVLGVREHVEEEIDGRADVTAAAAISWLSTNRRQPFFLWVHFFDPHYPWTAPEPWDQLYEDGTYDGHYDGGMGFVYEMREGVFEPNDRDVEYLRHQYASEVSFADHHIGKVLGYAAELGLLRNTIVVLTADHGESLGERPGPWTDGDDWLHGDDLYSPGIRVPLIVFDPRRPQPGQVLSPPIQHIDIMPTILELIRTPIPPGAQGRSLVPLLDGRDAGPPRVAITTLADDRATSIVSADGWKLIVNRQTGQRELYYLPNDPAEMADLSAIFPSRTAELTAQLDDWGRSSTQGLAARTPN